MDHKLEQIYDKRKTSTCMTSGPWNEKYNQVIYLLAQQQISSYILSNLLPIYG